MPDAVQSNETVEAMREELIEWRQDFHRHPELAFEEVRTSKIVGEKLEGFGLEVDRGLAGTGVVGTLRAGNSPRTIALRADMDALRITEANDFAHRSVNEGTMHACGHDGHTAMLLGAAKHLARSKRFDGTIHFIFQPAEENEGGARVMIEEGLFKRFPVDEVYGMHNMPKLPVGSFAVRKGPIMAAYDNFEAVITGRGTHAAMPHTGIDPVTTATQVVQAFQTIVSRNVDPLEGAVISVTQLKAGDTWNVIPDSVTLRGCTRSLEPAVQDLIEAGMERVLAGICAAHGASHQLTYRRGYPATINSDDETAFAIAAARAVAGTDNVSIETPPLMGSEDFAFMLQERPGCYLFIGNGDGEGTCMVHNSGYDFNDEILTLGVRYWVELAERQLAP